MKTKMNFRLWPLAVLLLMAQVLYAGQHGSMKVKTMALPQKQIRLAVRDVTPGPVQVSIRMIQTGEQVYETRLKKDTAYNRVFDLKQLPEGEYLLVVETEDQEYTASFVINADACLVYKESRNRKPMFESGDDNLLITWQNHGRQKVSVIFRNAMGKIFTDEVEDAGILQRKYNLTMLEPGDYEVDLVADGTTYNYRFEIR
ncbi:MAG: hypothetical protein JXQ80_06775 [Bacteroidales bacterium]|nr:hypothetical protein [Bacteroidales bacterium]